MTKQEFLEKYGEDAYQLKIKRQKEYYISHKEERLAYAKKKYRENIEEGRAANLKSYYKHIDKRKADQQIYRNEHKSEKKLYNQRYYQEHKMEMNAYSKEYRSTPIGRAKNLIAKYKQKDAEYNRGVCTLTDDYMVNILFPQGCFWCNEMDYHKLGADRIDNTKSHTPDNVVCSCWKCNDERGRMTFDEFMQKKKMAS